MCGTRHNALQPKSWDPGDNPYSHPRYFLGFRVPANTTHARVPWIQEIAQRPSDYSEPHCKDTHFGRSIFLDVFLKVLYDYMMKGRIETNENRRRAGGVGDPPS
jgi:hypothetical protein